MMTILANDDYRDTALDEHISKTHWVLRPTFRTTKRTKVDPLKVGDRMGSWVVVGAWTNRTGYLQSYKCKCDCGHIENYVNPSNLKVGNTKHCKSCGQATKIKGSIVDWSSVKWPKHIISTQQSLLKSRLNGMISRCDTDHHIKSNITVDKNWVENPQKFVEYITSLERWEDSSLIPDRINTRGNYEPYNIRFVTKKENARNLTTTKYLTYNGTEYDVASFMEKFYGVEKVKDNKKLYNFIHARLKEGLAGDRIVAYINFKRIARMINDNGNTKDS